MHCAKLTSNSPKKLSEKLRYLLVTEAAKAVAWEGTNSLDSATDAFRAFSHSGSSLVWTAVLSFADERSRPRTLEDARAAIVREVRERAGHYIVARAPMLVVFHGPPVEQTALHAHAVFVTHRVPPAHVRNAMQPQRFQPRNGAAQHDRANTTLTYDTLYEWLARHAPANWSSWLNAAKTRGDFERQLWNEYGLRYRMGEQGAIIEDPRTGVCIRPSKVDPALATSAIERRFGAAPAPPDTRTAPSRRYERTVREHITEDALRSHIAAREDFHSRVLPLRVEAYRSARERYLAACAQLALERQERLSELDAQPGERRVARAALRAEMDARREALHQVYRAERDQILRRYPRVDPNVQRWLRAQQKPEPPALFGITTNPLEPWQTQMQRDGRTALIHNGIRYATIETDGRLLLADRTLNDDLLRALPEATFITGDAKLCDDLRNRFGLLGMRLEYQPTPPGLDDAQEQTPSRHRVRSRAR